MDLHQKFTLCTLCLDPESNLLDVFEYNERGFKLSLVIQELLQFKVTKQGCIPWVSCTKCIGKLKDFVSFRNNATKSINILKCLLFDKKQHRGNTWENGSRIALEEDNGHFDEPEENVSCGNLVESVKDEPGSLDSHVIESEIALEEDNGHFDEPEENVSCGNLLESVKDEPGSLDSHVVESEMHVKNQNEQEIPPAEECLSISGEMSSFEGVQCSEAHGNTSVQVPLSEELMDPDDLHLYLSSDGSDDTSDAEDRSANVSGPETEVTNLSFGDVVRETVFGGGESVGNREETPEGEKDLRGLKDSERRFSARLRLGAKVPVATHSHLKQRRLRSHSKNENCGPSEGIESTPCSTSRNQFGERNEKCRQRKEETRRGSKHGNGALAGNISIGSSVGDEKSEGQDFMCDACGRVFQSKDLIERHVKVPCGSKLIDCGNCNKKFWARNQYKRHRSLHCGSNVSRGRAQKGVSVGVSGESEDRRQINKGIPLTCHICNKIFSDNSHLERHVKTVHLKERNFSCGICGKAFGEKGTLQTHMRYHNGVKSYTCTHCHKGFTEYGNLRRHIRAVHQMQKPHTCGECGKAFSLKGNLKKHILIHTGERPHTCDICSRSFSLKVNLKSHMLIHTGVKSYTCTLCSKTFRHNITLKRHMATHAGKVPRPCNLCTKAFAFRSDLKRHLAEHRGQEDD